MTDYIKREDAARAMAKYMMDTALIDNPEASDRIEEWEGSIAAPVMSTVEAADVRENVKGRWIEKHYVINCSVCKKCLWSSPYIDLVKKFNFCPNCGADMRGEV